MPLRATLRSLCFNISQVIRHPFATSTSPRTKCDTSWYFDVGRQGVVRARPRHASLPLVIVPIVIRSVVRPFTTGFPLLRSVTHVHVRYSFALSASAVLRHAGSTRTIVIVNFRVASSVLSTVAIQNRISYFTFNNANITDCVGLPVTHRHNVHIYGIIRCNSRTMTRRTFTLVVRLTQRINQLSTRIHHNS